MISITYITLSSRKNREEGVKKREGRYTKNPHLKKLSLTVNTRSKFIFKSVTLRISSGHVLQTDIRFKKKKIYLFFYPVARILKKLHRTAITGPVFINHLYKPLP